MEASHHQIFVTYLLEDFVQQNGVGRATSTNNLDKVSWGKLGSFVFPIIRVGIGCHTMLGPMNYELKQEKVAVEGTPWWSGSRTYEVKRQKIAGKHPRLAERARPEKFNAIAEENLDTDKIMGTMFEILREKRRVKLECLLLNRKSFAQTVENLFALSFLVKDGCVAIHVDENGSHLVSPRNAPASRAVLSGEVTFHQFTSDLISEIESS